MNDFFIDQPRQTILPASSVRIDSVDVLRGFVMVIMALDHVREFWSATPYRPEDLTQASVALFFTRWVTHFCAPTFVFLSGISVFLYARKKQNRQEVSAFLLKRGLWLVALEVLVINFLWQFNIQLILIQVIWVIGWSMIFMAGIIWLPRWVIAALSLVMIAGHNLLPDTQPMTAAAVGLGILHHTPFVVPPGILPPILVAYTLVPWIGVMMAGYLIGPWFSYPLERRIYWLRVAGVALLSVFVLLRFINRYGDPSTWSVQSRGFTYTALSFLNISKYPPSLLFLCLTLGVALLLLAGLEGSNNRLGRWLRTFGQVPFFFYLLHIPIISASALLWTSVAFGQAVNLSLTPPNAWPAIYQPNLLRAYLVWMVVIGVLYLPCQWYGRYRQQHAHWWLSYV